MRLLSNHIRVLYVLFSMLFWFKNTSAQKSITKNNSNLVYVDRQGILRWTKNNTEASFFVVNYTTPFAYAYRAHKALNADLEKAI